MGDRAAGTLAKGTFEGSDEGGGLGQLSIEVILAGEVPKKESNGVDREIVLLWGLRTLPLGISMAEEVAS